LTKCNVRITLETKILRNPTEFCANITPSSLPSTSTDHGQNQYAREESSSNVNMPLDSDDFLDIIFEYDENNQNVNDLYDEIQD